MKDIFLGFGDIQEGFRFFFRNRRLYKWAIIPFIINILLFYFVLQFMLLQAPLMMGWFEAQLGTVGFLSWAWLSWLQGFLLWLLKAILWMVLFFISVVMTLIVSQIINSPFYDFLSETVEVIQGTMPESKFSWGPFIVDLFRNFWIEIKKALFLILTPLLFLFFHILPVIGATLYFLSSNLFIAWDFGLNYISYPMSRRMIPFWKQISLASEHKVRLIAFGTPLMIPLLNLLVAPFFVVGGTLLYEKIKEGHALK